MDDAKKESFYNLWKNTYDNSRLYRLTIANLDQLIPKYGRVLDLGCGNGFVMSNINYKGRKLFGVDLNNYFPDFLRTLGLNYASGNLYGLGYKSFSFDCVYMLDVFEHLEEPDKSLIEARRIIKKGGILVLGTPNVNRLANLFRKMTLRLKFPRLLSVDKYMGEVWHIKEYDIGDIKKHLEKNGFGISEVRYIFFGISLPTRKPIEIGLTKCPSLLKKYCHYYLVKAVALKDG